MTLIQIVSGGQTGVYIAALRAAKACGLRTGGWMPRGWMPRGFRTQAGRREDYRDLYGMREHPKFGYRESTYANVNMADATLRLAVNFRSVGELCTWNAIVRHRKPYLDVQLVETVVSRHYTTEIDFAAQVDGTVRWLREGRLAVVNVAGNSEATAPGIEAFAEVFLREVFAATLRAAAEDGQPLSPEVPPPMMVPPWAGRR